MAKNERIPNAVLRRYNWTNWSGADKEDQVSWTIWFDIEATEKVRWIVS